jgi:hypothetical protein
MLFTGILITIGLLYNISNIIKMNKKELLLTNNDLADEVLFYILIGLTTYCTYNFFTYKDATELLNIEAITFLAFTFTESIKAYNERKIYYFFAYSTLFILMFIKFNHLL